MIPQEFKQDVVNKIMAIPTFAKHLAKRGEIMGTNLVMIAPITIWANHIEIMCDTRRNVFKTAIKQFMENNKEVTYMRFIRGYGFTPYLYIGITQSNG